MVEVDKAESNKSKNNGTKHINAKDCRQDQYVRRHELIDQQAYSLQHQGVQGGRRVSTRRQGEANRRQGEQRDEG